LKENIFFGVLHFRKLALLFGKKNITFPFKEYLKLLNSRGGYRGGAPGARPPKIGKKYDFFLVKS